jgi:uncharacterized protein (TIGR02145 family)
MKNFVILFILLLSILISINACTKVVPSCNILSPSDDEEIEQGDTSTILIEAEGDISEVRFYINDSVVGSSNNSPYAYDWNTTGVKTDTHKITSIVESDYGFYVYDELEVIITVHVTDFEGNKYQGVQIGNQIWMAENLKTTHYSDGTPIPMVLQDSDWENLGNEDKAYCYFNNSVSNLNTYGALYTWAATMNGQPSSKNNPSGVQGICPNGWHLPSMTEWEELLKYIEAENISLSESGFSPLYAGFRESDGEFRGITSYAYFWCSVGQYPNTAWRLSLVGLGFKESLKNAGFCVRCIKD